MRPEAAQAVFESREDAEDRGEVHGLPGRRVGPMVVVRTLQSSYGKNNYVPPFDKNNRLLFPSLLLLFDDVSGW